MSIRICSEATEETYTLKSCDGSADKGNVEQTNVVIYLCLHAGK